MKEEKERENDDDNKKLVSIMTLRIYILRGVR